MKKPEYVATVTATYRRCLDEGQATREMEQLLLTAFNRQGFTDGYYTGKVDRNMFGVREETKDNPAWIKAARQSYETGESQLVNITFDALVTRDGSRLRVTDPEGRGCTVEGPVPEVARNVEITGQAIADRLCKTGGTPYRCVGVEAQVEPGLTLSAAAINAMRRDVLNQLTAVRARHQRHPLGKPQRLKDYLGSGGMPGLTVQVTTREQITSQLMALETAMLYVPIHILLSDHRLTRQLVRRGNVAAVLPRIAHDDELTKLRLGLNDLYNQGVRDVLVGNLSLMIAAREAGMTIHGDFGLNIYNSRSLNVCRELELASACLSFEMTLPQIRDLSKAVPAEIIAYGRLPLMVVEHCLMKNRTGQCTCHLGPAKLTDKIGAEFPIIKDGENCRSVLLNGKKLYWLDRQEDLRKLGLWAVRLYFTTENAQETDRCIADFIQGTPMDPGSCTRGLYLRGLD